MAKKKDVLTGKFADAELYLKSLVIDSEYKVAEANNQEQYQDYESILDMVELIRNEKNYDWQSNIFIGLLLSHMLTDTATWAAQDFASRDFTDVIAEGNNPGDLQKAKSAKVLLNALLNVKDVYHFQKRLRGRTINWIFGQVYALVWWEKKTAIRRIPRPPLVTVARDIDEEGNIVPRVVQQEQEPYEEEVIIYDRFNYDVFDARNVFTDFSYTYSAQQKSWITLRSEKKWSQIQADAEQFNYFNLDVLKEKLFGTEKERKVRQTPESETSKKTFNKMGGAYNSKQKIFKEVDPTLDVLDRYGLIWAVVKERGDQDEPIDIEPGYDSYGSLDPKGELVEAIITYVGMGEEYTMIGFRPTWAVDSKGQPFKPIIRGWCYVHPTKDIGLSDGKNLREMNIAANDTFNICNDRTMLATLPVMKGRRDALEGNPTVFIEPENVIMLEHPNEDLVEMQIRDNIQGGMTQMAFIKGTSSEMDAIWPTTMGGLPEKTSTTATAVAGAENRTGARGNLKAMTWAYTFDVEFYTMILQLAYRFMDEKTLKKILGEELFQSFDPDGDFTYIPISENLEGEQSKAKKIQNYDQMMGRLQGLMKIAPKEILPIVAWIVGQQATLLGGEYREIERDLKTLASAKPQEEGKGAESTKDGKPPMTQNQFGGQPSATEEMARGM
jgi:hypothetical protein